MQPQAAKWKPNPQPSRTNVMIAAGCGRTDGIGEACAPIDDDASTPQVRTNDNDNLLNIDKNLLWLCTDGIIPENTNYTSQGYIHE